MQTVKTKRQKGVCPSCGKRGLGHVFPSPAGAYRQCTYCGEQAFVREHPVAV